MNPEEVEQLLQGLMEKGEKVALRHEQQKEQMVQLQEENQKLRQQADQHAIGKPHPKNRDMVGQWLYLVDKHIQQVDDCIKKLSKVD